MNWKEAVMAALFIAAAWWVYDTYRDNQQLKTDNTALNSQLAEQTAINKDYKARIQSLHELDITNTQELTNAKTEIDSLRDAVKFGSKRVYVRTVCPKSRADTTESGGNEAAPRLSEATEQDYWHLREMMVENEKQTMYLQDYIKVECK